MRQKGSRSCHQARKPRTNRVRSRKLLCPQLATDPRMFGFWLTVRRRSKCPRGCLVLERFGVQLHPFGTWNFPKNIHLDSDSHPRNGQEFRIIDLESLIDHNVRNVGLWQSRGTKMMNWNSVVYANQYTSLWMRCTGD